MLSPVRHVRVRSARRDSPRSVTTFSGRGLRMMAQQTTAGVAEAPLSRISTALETFWLAAGLRGQCKAAAGVPGG